MVLYRRDDRFSALDRVGRVVVSLGVGCVHKARSSGKNLWYGAIRQ